MRLIIVRHGETEENLAGIIQGHLPGKLSAKGLLQAQKAAEWLKDENIDIIYSSDLARAADTATIIAHFHPNVPLLFTKQLRERFLGTLQGKQRPEVFENGKMLFDKLNSDDSETRENLNQRAQQFYHKILLKHSHHTVLIVGHNGINKALLRTIINKDDKAYKSVDILHNTSISIFKIDSSKHYVTILLNSKKHLL